MPTYEYLCATCDHRYEKREGFDAPAKQKCPNCGKASSRVLSAPAVVFKGTGFYKTDSRGESGRAGSAAASGTDSESTPAAAPPAADAGHGHSHGPGGHSHDVPAPATTTPAADSKPKSKSKESTGSAAAG